MKIALLAVTIFTLSGTVLAEPNAAELAKLEHQIKVGEESSKNYIRGMRETSDWARKNILSEDDFRMYVREVKMQNEYLSKYSRKLRENGSDHWGELEGGAYSVYRATKAAMLTSALREIAKSKNEGIHDRLDVLEDKLRDHVLALSQIKDLEIAGLHATAERMKSAKR